MKTGVIIVAAGRGERAGGDRPKQYREIAGEAVLARTVRAFQQALPGSEICVVINTDDQARFDQLGLQTRIAFGGATRTASVRAGLDALETAAVDSVLIHDAARPFVSRALIQSVLDKLLTAEAALPALGMTDALLSARDGEMTGSLNRDEVFAAQTPQGFHYQPLMQAYSRLGCDAMHDDASVAASAGMTVAIVDGDPANFKITRPEDFQKAETMLRASEPIFVTGQGYDVHRLEAAEVMWLCGVEIHAGLGLVGHSDADAGLHALTDAVLGAAGAGDIGQHFPPSDPRWSGASSDQFLMHALELLGQAGGEIVHADITIICERPKVGPHRDAMRQRIAELLGLPLARVNIKATTTEKLGFTGRGEGLAAQAVATARMG
ncbi:bifunctional 2-C-methyl-D-erythritol 4-phosphate cytidylyltransferase/2-C-methyl-D-erythritol 2,4-cyclodiphosphate synthase [Maricaulis sp.]|uniref:bifunctional 2-C-methyl-D-erythritol 4-phosphate cytidylyltransferase/2-C-methyl-D-erythritol 2,4-cyclodiphosphate synthase n=1 Tax=Maricaulis sp. TaxID=1486257 RepID=UPI002602CAB5|nr:bifunctional 2-C-methyl-D-erythritol 4-phosphate cytidylyltransferase/2-C-methyl-D-erythritol 2,4-cyclodiphosphate synthase [Maricaulis sp.]